MKKIILGVFFVATCVTQAFAATVYVDPTATGTGDGSSQVNAFTTIQAAHDAVSTVAGDTIEIYGTHTITASVNITKDVTLNGNTATISTTGANYVFLITGAGATIQNLSFTKTDKPGPQNIIGVQANNVTISGNTFSGQYVFGDGDVSRGIEVSPAVTGLLIDNNSFTNLRQPAYINDDATGTISNNFATGTRGWVIESDSTMTLSGNTFGTNILGFAIIVGNGTVNNYADIVTISSNNSNAAIENQFGGTPVLDSVHVDGSVAVTGNGLAATPYKTIAEAIPRVTSGGKIYVKSGSYIEDLTINKSLKIYGENGNINPVNSFRSAESILTGSILITSSDVTVDGFQIQNPVYSGPSVKGIHIFGAGPTISNIQISNNIISDISNSTVPVKGAYGVMVQADVNGVVIDSNVITNITTAGWARGIEVTPSCGVVNIPQNVEIINNNISNIVDTDGDDEYNISVDWCSSVPRIADASQLQVQGNIFDSTRIKNLDTAHELVLKKNYWGSNTPSFITHTGSINFEPWCLANDCVTYWTQPGSSGWGSGSTMPLPATSTAATSTLSTASTTATTTLLLSPATTSTSTIPQVLGATTFKFLKGLGYGARGEDVINLQQLLLDKGYLKLRSGKPTGWFGPLTRAALAKWQAENNIPATGYLGTISRELLNK